MKIEIFLYGTLWFDHGVATYKAQPPGTRLASEDDFIKNGRLNVGKWFLIHCFHSGHYSAWKVNSDFTFDKIRPWLDADRVFVHL